MSGPTYKKVYDLVRLIPEGKVLTYGLISHKLEGRLSAQGVGWALRALPSERKGRTKSGLGAESESEYNSANVPWQRVINAQGGISTGRTGDMPPDMQKKLLRKEGVRFNKEDKVDLERYLWKEFYIL
jgi:methylated-DNA-protein-cysteine methyltransferase related protein